MDSEANLKDFVVMTGSRNAAAEGCGEFGRREQKGWRRAGRRMRRAEPPTAERRGSRISLAAGGELAARRAREKDKKGFL